MESEGRTGKPTGTRYPDEVCERAIRMVFEHQHEYQTQGAAIRSIAWKMGMSRETLRNWIIQAERDRGQRARARHCGATGREWPERLQLWSHAWRERGICGFMGAGNGGRHARLTKPRSPWLLRSPEPNL
jgi:transposase-like protein